MTVIKKSKQQKELMASGVRTQEQKDDDHPKGVEQERT